MNNKPNNSNEQFNDSGLNQPDSQNRDFDVNNTQPSLGTYSAIPEIFNDRNTVSQDRTIPMQSKPAGNNIPSLRKAPNAGTAKPENNQDASQGINIQKKPSSGRAFVEEFYSAPLNNANTQMPLQTDRVIPMSETNGNADNSIIQNNTENTQKQDVKYNYEAFTKPNKKSTLIIILVYIVVVVLLLVGVIGFLLGRGNSDNENNFAQLFKNIESVFAEEDIDSENPNRFNITDIFTDENNVFENQTTLPEPNVKGEPKTLRYEDSTGESDFQITVYAPYGHSLYEDSDIIDRAFYSTEGGYNCKAKLIRGYSSTDDILYDDIINPYGEDCSFANKCSTYPTAYGEATIWYAKFANRGEAYAFIDMEDEGILSVSLDIFDLYNVPYDQDSCILKLQNILDDMLIKE